MLEKILFPQFILTGTKLRKTSKAEQTDAPEPDHLWLTVLQSLAEELSTSLSIVYRLYLDEGAIPFDWKRGHSTLIFKKGS